jgi:hypothetical protein
MEARNNSGSTGYLDAICSLYGHIHTQRCEQLCAVLEAQNFIKATCQFTVIHKQNIGLHNCIDLAFKSSAFFFPLQADSLFPTEPLHCLLLCTQGSDHGGVINSTSISDYTKSVRRLRHILQLKYVSRDKRK